MGIWEGILSAAAFIAIGWSAHAFFHRREHDQLKREIKNRPESLVDILSGIEDVRTMKLSEDEVLMLKSINKGITPLGWSEAKMKLVGGRLEQKSLIDESAYSASVTQTGLEWLDAHGKIE